MRVNSLGPEEPDGWMGGWLKLAAGGAACTGGGTGGGVHAGALGAGGAGSLEAERDAKVCVQAPGSWARGGLNGAGSMRGDGFTGSSSI